MQGNRRLIIGANWKCNLTQNAATALINNVLNKIEYNKEKVEVLVSPIALHIPAVKAQINQNIHVALQNLSATPNGAFTGEISAEQAVDFGLEWVIIGHSERRHVFGESYETVAKKVAMAQKHKLNAIVCIGETAEQRDADHTNEVLAAMLESVKSSVEDWSKIVIAYEPVWAIGTGKAATPEMAEETHKFIRSWVAANASEEIAQNLRIQYGGSVTGKNAGDLIKKENIDGFLVGGASLKEEFADIINAADQINK